MGQISSCEKCNGSHNSVITFSDDLILKLTEDIEPEPLDPEQIRLEEIGDKQWMDRIKCLDECHSNAYGLTVDQFNLNLHRLQKRLMALDVEPPCQQFKLIECYKQYPSGCKLNCSQIAEEYIDCIDGKTMKLLKNRLEEQLGYARKLAGYTKSMKKKCASK